MNTIQLMRANYQMAHGLLDTVLADCGDSLHEPSPGQSNTIAAIYAHVVIGEDFFASMVRAQPLILDAAWAAKTGLPVVTMPRLTPELAQVRLNLEPFKEYATAVYERTDATIAGLSEADLDREVDSPLGKTTLANLVGTIGFYHVAEHTGEIAALKGVRGLKGLPF